MRRLLTLLLLCAVVLAAPAGAVLQKSLPGVVDPAPRASGWVFKAGEPYIFPVPWHYPTFTLQEWLGSNPTDAQRTAAVELRQAGFVTGRNRAWDTRDAKLVVVAFLFRSAAGARGGFRALQHGGPERPYRGLGQEALEIRYGTYFTYAWRRANVVVSASALCKEPCSAALRKVVRGWAGQLDGRATRAR